MDRTTLSIFYFRLIANSFNITGITARRWKCFKQTYKKHSNVFGLVNSLFDCKYYLQAIIVCIVGAAFMLISFFIEAWFTAGLGLARSFQWFYIQSWLASTVTCNL